MYLFKKKANYHLLRKINNEEPKECLPFWLKITLSIFVLIIISVIIYTILNLQNEKNNANNTSTTDDEYIINDNTNDNCNNKLPFGSPILLLNKSTNIDICHEAFTAKYDTIGKIPIWTAYIISNETILGCEKRSNKFSPDPTIPLYQSAIDSDYKNSGYDRGHMAPSADLLYDLNVNIESFYYTNILPQLSYFNQGIWQTLEDYVRLWSYNLTNQNHKVQIIIGTMYNNISNKIGSGVIVPDYFFKILIDINNTDNFFAFSFPNNATFSNLTIYQTTIDSIEKQYNIIFPMNIKKNKINELNVVNNTLYCKQKFIKCGKSCFKNGT